MLHQELIAVCVGWRHSTGLQIPPVWIGRPRPVTMNSSIKVSPLCLTVHQVDGCDNSSSIFPCSD